jgi:hypothetical protein
MEINIELSDVPLWGEEVFSKNSWGSINYLVGSNGTGKTRFCESIKTKLTQDFFRVRYLSAERLSGLEKQRYSTFARSDLEQGLNISQIDNYENQASQFGLSSSAFTILRKKIDVRIKVEAFVSELLGRGIKLVEEGGFLKPKLQKNGSGGTYDLKSDECHGLKEIITLLTYIYDDTYNCLIIDEPELHLHPHFQNLLLREIKKYSGDPSVNPDKKIFFLVTHSPSFVQLRSLDDLKNLIIFSSNKKPCYVHELNQNDEYKLKRLLPRVNIHHKQLFFEKSPVFVEGYFDQQIFAEVQEKRDKVAQGSFIDVGGKEEVDLYYRLTRQLNIEAKCIVDLDALFRGALRQSASQDSRVNEYLAEEGLNTDLMRCIGELERSIHTQIENISNQQTQINPLSEYLTSDAEQHHKVCAFIVALFNEEQYLEVFQLAQHELTFVRSRLNQILEALKKTGVYILPNGVLENYLPAYNGNIFSINSDSKYNVFVSEREWMEEHGTNPEDVRGRYPQLCETLDACCEVRDVSYDSYLNYTISDLIYGVQMAFRRGEFSNQEGFIESRTIVWSDYERIMELDSFDEGENNTFTCKIRLKELLDADQRLIEFNENTQASLFSL